MAWMREMRERMASRNMTESSNKTENIVSERLEDREVVPKEMIDLPTTTFIRTHWKQIRAHTPELLLNTATQAPGAPSNNTAAEPTGGIAKRQARVTLPNLPQEKPTGVMIVPPGTGVMMNKTAYYDRRFNWIRCMAGRELRFEAGGPWVSDGGKNFWEGLQDHAKRCGPINRVFKYMNGLNWGPVFIEFSCFWPFYDLKTLVRSINTAGKKFGNAHGMDFYIYRCPGFDEYEWQWGEVPVNRAKRVGGPNTPWDFGYGDGSMDTYQADFQGTRNVSNPDSGYDQGGHQ